MTEKMKYVAAPEISVMHCQAQVFKIPAAQIVSNQLPIFTKRSKCVSYCKETYQRLSLKIFLPIHRCCGVHKKMFLACGSLNGKVFFGTTQFLCMPSYFDFRETQKL